MKKLSAFIAITLLSVSTFARQIPENELQSYKESFKLALSNAKLQCVFEPSEVKWHDGTSRPEYLLNVVNATTSAVLDDSGAQPILSFKFLENLGELTVAITTTDDFSSIVSVEVSIYDYSYKKINLGTIINPNIVTKQVKSLVASAFCN